MILNITIWLLLIMSWVLPKKWFKDKNDLYATQLWLSIIALTLIGLGLINIYFKWF